MIQAEPDPQKRDEYLQRLMELPNQVFTYGLDKMYLGGAIYFFICLFIFFCVLISGFCVR